MRYVYLRIFLSSIEQPLILVETGDVPKRLDRQDYLTDIFNRRWQFVHRGTDLIYVPIERSEEDDAIYTFGRIGKQFSAKENAGPEEKFETTEHKGWRASNLVINTSSDPDGQIVAIQDRPDVGKPLAILSSLSDHINETMRDSGWMLSVNAMVEQQDFWAAVRKYKGQITKAEFTYVTPNVLGIRSELNKRLKEYREHENAQSVTVSLSEPKGDLNLETDEVADAVDYTASGGGSVKLKAGRETVYDSQDSEKAKEMETDDTTNFESAEGRKSLVGRVFE